MFFLFFFINLFNLTNFLITKTNNELTARIIIDETIDKPDKSQSKS